MVVKKKKTLTSLMGHEAEPPLLICFFVVVVVFTHLEHFHFLPVAPLHFKNMMWKRKM